MIESKDRKLEAFRMLVPHLRGALWWGRDDAIKEQCNSFVTRADRIGHPLLSVRQGEIENRYETIPMLVGTSGNSMDAMQRLRCMAVSGLTSEDPAHKTYFGSIIQPILPPVEEMMDAVSPKKGDIVEEEGLFRDGETARFKKRPWHNSHRLWPNHDKPSVSEDEMKALESWCKTHGM